MSPSLNTILNVTPEPIYSDVLLIKNQDTRDIIKELLKAHKLYWEQACNMADQFRGRTVRETAQKIHTFLKRYSNYEIEPVDKQTSKSINRYIHGSTTEPYLLGDCKHQSLFTTAILKCIYPDLPIFFRFTSYKILDSSPSHVYSGIKDESGNIWTIDPLQEFNREKFYISKIDKKVPMALSRLSGISSPMVDYSGMGGVNLIKKVSLALPRNAFLLLVRLNPFKIGSKMKQANSISPSKTREWWEKFGGSYSSLVKAINSVQKELKPNETVDPSKLPVGSPERDAYCEQTYSKIGLNRGRCKNGKINGMIGTDPVVVTAMATATPLIIAMTGFLKQVGVGVDTDLQRQADTLMDNVSNGSYDQNGDNSTNGAGGSGAGGWFSDSTLIAGNEIPNVALAGAGLLGAYLILK